MLQNNFINIFLSNKNGFLFQILDRYNISLPTLHTCFIIRSNLDMQWRIQKKWVVWSPPTPSF